MRSSLKRMFQTVLSISLGQQCPLTWKVTLKLEMLDTRRENVIALVGATGEAYLARQERNNYRVVL